MHVLVRFAAPVFLFLLASCGGVSSPVLTVSEIKPDASDASGKRMLIVVNAENRSDVPLPLKDASYTFRLDGREVFSGQRSPESTLRKYGVQTLVFPVAIPADKLPTGNEAQYEISGSVVYLPPGKFNEILYDYHLLRPTTSFGKKGLVDLAAVPPAPPPRPASEQPGGKSAENSGEKSGEKSGENPAPPAPVDGAKPKEAGPNQPSTRSP
jgi:hypothetical protein